MNKDETVDEMISRLADEAYKELQGVANRENAEKDALCHRYNEAPCSVCGKKEFVLKYRNVHGKTTGRVSGYFSLFGGSISGSIDGSVETSPVLSCRECGNERIISVFQYTSVSDIWSRQIPFISEYEPITKDQKKVSEWLQSKGLEVALKLSRMVYPSHNSEKFYEWSDSTYPKYSIQQFANLGLFIKYPKPTPPTPPKLWNRIVDWFMRT